MSEIGDDFKALKDHLKEKQSAYIETMMDSDIELVKSRCKSSKVRNDGMHIILTTNKDTKIDYWPTRRKWISRKRDRGFSVDSLITYIERN